MRFISFGEKNVICVNFKNLLEKIIIWFHLEKKWCCVNSKKLTWKISDNGSTSPGTTSRWNEDPICAKRRSGGFYIDFWWGFTMVWWFFYIDFWWVLHWFLVGFYNGLVGYSMSGFDSFGFLSPIIHFFSLDLFHYQIN